MARSPILLVLVLCAVIALASHPRAVAQEEEGEQRGAARPLPGRRPSSSSSQSSGAERRAELARARAIGKGSGAARGGGGGGRTDAIGEQTQQQGPSSSSSSSSSAAAAARQERLRTADERSTAAEDYAYIPVDGRVLLRPRSTSKLRDYTFDVYGGINEVAQAQPFFGAASVAGRVGLAARYNLDYSDYLSPRQINARIGPTAHVATVATGRAQGTAGAKAATDSVRTTRASYRLDVADAMAFETGVVSQTLNAASAGATVERDQANDPFYATVADPGPGLVGKKRRRTTR